MPPKMDFADYDLGPFYDEMFEAPGRPRPGCRMLYEKILSLPAGEVLTRQSAAEQALYDMGITFTVYGHEDGTEKIFPFDIIPRVIKAAEWDVLERGLIQRITALNLFIDDVYHQGRIVSDGIVPRSVVETSSGYFKECQGLNPPRGVWCHITGTDLVRDTSGRFLVLEDNLRCPSGVSYVLANRRILKRAFPQVFEAINIRTVDDYPPLCSTCSRPSPPPGATAGQRPPCSRRACSTRPISSTPSWPSRPASSSWKAATSWSWTAACTCAPPRDSSAWT